MLKAWPSARVGDLASMLGVSERHLLRRFRVTVGYGPKILDRVLRFQRALKLLRRSADRLGLADVAGAAGYADQAHMTPGKGEAAMRNVILSMAVSLDGSIARADGDLNWFLSDDGFETEMLSLLRSVDAMMFGRVSYELLAQYWPSAGTAASGDAPGGFTTKEREIAFAGLMNSIPKIVFSRTLKKAEWGPATLVRDSVAQEIARMKREPGNDFVLFAGAGIASTFINLDLIDEYRLLVHPIVLGTGISLFKDVTEERNLKLTRTKTFSSGVVLLQYERDRSSRTT